MLFVFASGFAAQVALWHDFYALAGAAAATLLGLLFVAMSLHNDPAGRNLDVERDLWILAAGVLANFADIVLCALVFLVPGQTPLGIGFPLLILGTLSLLLSLQASRRVRQVTTDTRWTLPPALLSCLFQALAGVGVIVGVGESVWLNVLAVATGMLLLSALLASWLLLSRPALAMLRRSAPPASPPTT